MESLGINIANLLINTALFAGFFALMHKFVLTKIGVVLAERKKLIDDGVLNFNKSKDILNDVNKEREEMLSVTEKKSKELLRETQLKADMQAKSIVQKAYEEAKEIRLQANASLESQKKKLAQDFNKRLEEEVKSSLKEILKESENSLLK